MTTLVRLAGLVALGLLVGVMARSGSAPAGPPAHAPEPAHAEPPSPGTEGQSPAERIDDLIRSGDFAHGLERCRAVPPTTFGPDDRSQAVREAVCLEGLGRWAEAGERYAHAAGADENQPLWAWATLGEARCAAAGGDPAAARERLNRVVLRSGRRVYGSGEVLEECLHLRSRLAVDRLAPPRAADPLDSAALAWPAPAFDPDWLLDRLGPTKQPDAVEPPRPYEVEQSAIDWTTLVVSANRPGGTVADHLAALAKAANLSLTIDPAVVERLSIPAGPVAVDEAPLTEVLTALTEPATVGWEIAGDDLRVGPAAEPARDGRAAAADVLDRATTLAPDHPAARVMALWAANVAHEAGRGRAAAAGYRRLVTDEPHAPECVPAVYNLGLLELAAGRPAAARAWFVELVDRAPRTRWADLGRWWVGRSHLDAGDPAAALRPFRIAQSGSNREVRAAAALGAVACHLLADDHEAARAELRRREPAVGEPQRELGEAFEAMTRFQTAPSDGRYETAEVALRATRNVAALGPAGAYLAGRFHRAAGRPDRMVELFDAHSAGVRGPLAARMVFEAAERLRELGLDEAARSRYLAVAAADPDTLGPRATLRLADLAARAGHGPECVRLCRRLLAHPGAEPAEVLAVLGRGHELEGRFGHAAAAFAGHVPAE